MVHQAPIVISKHVVTKIVQSELRDFKQKQRCISIGKVLIMGMAITMDGRREVMMIKIYIVLSHSF